VCIPQNQSRHIDIPIIDRIK